MYMYCAHNYAKIPYSRKLFLDKRQNNCCRNFSGLNFCALAKFINMPVDHFHNSTIASRKHTHCICYRSKFLLHENLQKKLNPKSS